MVVLTIGLNLNIPMLLIYSDGGPDHHTSFWSVQLAHVMQFIVLDLALLIAAHTAPHHSYSKPAERIMSQYCHAGFYIRPFLKHFGLVQQMITTQTCPINQLTVGLSVFYFSYSKPAERIMSQYCHAGFYIRPFLKHFGLVQQMITTQTCPINQLTVGLSVFYFSWSCTVCTHPLTVRQLLCISI